MCLKNAYEIALATGRGLVLSPVAPHFLFNHKTVMDRSYVKALFDRKKPGWVGYPGIFFDQQLAACATIAFVKNEGSTFSNFINELRKDNLTETCNHGMDIP